jgi:hypothetical protein
MRTKTMHAIRFSALTVFALVVSACNSNSESPDAGARAFMRPDVFLRSLAGEQLGNYIGICWPDSTDCGSFAELLPDRVSSVHTGDEITFAVPDGELVWGGNCNGDICTPSLSVQGFDCGVSSVAREFPLSQSTPWIVDLDPGTYLLWLGARLRDQDGSAVDASIGFAVTVDDDAQREVYPFETAQGLACPDAG